VSTVAATDAALHPHFPRHTGTETYTMNTPNDADLAALRAECNVLRLMLSLLVRDNVERDMLPGIGLERWCGPEMAAVVTGELGPHATPEQSR
jgi:hypothetical protein